MGATTKSCGSCILFIITTFIVYKLSLPVFMESFDPEGDTRSDDRDLMRDERTYNGGRHLLCIKFNDNRLGNKLFKYASALGIAHRQHRIILSNGDEALQNLLVKTNFATEKNHCKGVVQLVETACCKYDDRMVHLDTDKNYEIEGFLQSWRYFKEHENVIRDSIVFQAALLQQAKENVERALDVQDMSVFKGTLVGIHVRRGDMGDEHSVEFGYRLPPKEYFHKAITLFRERLIGPVTFLVVTVDRDWTEKNILGPSDILFVPSISPEMDLATLSLLDHTVTSIGTLSWWAGFLARGTVVYYEGFAAKGSKLMAEYGGNFDDYVYPGWIPLA